MSSRGFNLIAAAIGIVLIVGCQQQQPSRFEQTLVTPLPDKNQALEGRRPNIVLIIADDVSYNDLGCYGNPDVKTPHLDAMAASGQRWTCAYLTTSQCSPTRCSILTGRYPHNTGAPELHTPLPADQWCFTLSLRDAGYWCAQAGKWHLGRHAVDSFDVVHQGRQGGPGGEGRWVQTLRDRPADQPFFCWFAATDGHRPWQPDPDAEPHDPNTLQLPPPLVDTAETRADLAQYYDEVQRLDRFVGDVIAELRRQDVLDNTVILFIADNGRPFPRAKRWLVSDGILTPFIMHWPAGLPGEGTVCEELVSVLDIAPTFLELAGAEVPESFQGRSFLPQIASHRARICEMVFAERNWHAEYAHERMLRRGDWVYLRNAAPDLCHFAVINVHLGYPAYSVLSRHAAAGAVLTPAQRDTLLSPRPAEQLFYLPDDPNMLHDLADDPDYVTTLAEMGGLMDQWQDETGDTVPSPETRTPDRQSRETGERTAPGNSPHPGGGEMPGDTTNAAHLNASGPR